MPAGIGAAGDAVACHDFRRRRGELGYGAVRQAAGIGVRWRRVFRQLVAMEVAVLDQSSGSSRSTRATNALAKQ